MTASDFNIAVSQILILYNHEAANELQKLATTDPQGAFELAAAALHPHALEMKYRIDASERKSRS